MKYPVPKLAFAMLFYQKAKTLGAIGAVAFATGLCLMQLGMRIGAMNSMAVVPANSSADIWVVSSGSLNFDFTFSLDERDSYKVLTVNGVDQVETILAGQTKWRLGKGGFEVVEIIGIQRGATMLTPWNLVEGDTTGIHHDRAVIIDRTDLVKLDSTGMNDSTEIFQTPSLGMQAKVIGLTEGIRTFINSPIVFTGLTNARAFTGFGEKQATAILVRVKQGFDPVQVARSINQACGPDLWAATRREFCDHTIKYWSDGTGVGNFFLVLAAMGIIIGLGTLAIVQHIQVTDHLRQFAILKALGASSFRIGGLIVFQALILGVLGFGMGMVFAITTQMVLHAANFLIEVSLSPALFYGVFLGTCFFSTLAAIPGLVLIARTDPDLVFRN